MTPQLPERLTGLSMPAGIPALWRHPGGTFVTWVVQLAARTFTPHDFRDWKLDWKPHHSEWAMRAELDIPLLPMRPHRESQYVVRLVMSPRVTGAALIEEFGRGQPEDRVVSSMGLLTGLVSDFVGWFSYIREVWIREWAPKPIADFGAKTADMMWALPIRAAILKAEQDDVTITMINARQQLTPELEGVDIKIKRYEFGDGFNVIADEGEA